MGTLQSIQKVDHKRKEVLRLEGRVLTKVRQHTTICGSRIFYCSMKLGNRCLSHRCELLQFVNGVLHILLVFFRHMTCSQERLAAVQLIRHILQLLAQLILLLTNRIKGLIGSRLQIGQLIPHCIHFRKLQRKNLLQVIKKRRLLIVSLGSRQGNERIKVESLDDLDSIRILSFIVQIIAEHENGLHEQGELRTLAQFLARLLNSCHSSG